MSTPDPRCPTPPKGTREELVQQIVDLWDGNRGWIPGADIRRLSEILGVPLRTANEIGRDSHKDCTHRECVETRNNPPKPIL